MDQKTYLDQRLDDQITWYDNKSQYNKKWLKRLKMLEIVSATLIPLFSTAIDAVDFLPWLVGGLGVIVAISAAAISFYNFQENWIEYRTTAEQLKHEKYLFLTQSQPYAEDGAFQRLVMRVEGLISAQNSKWAEAVSDKANKDN